MNKQKIIFTLGTLVVLLLQACNLPNESQTQESEIDPLVAAEMTITALAGSVTQPATQEVLPTFTELPTLSPTPEFTAAPAFTATPSFAYITLSEATNCRVGPAVAFNLVDTFVVGQTIEVVGKHPFDNYWYVRSPKNASVYCWLWGYYATGANLGNVPVLTPPPTYTPAPVPAFDASYVNSGKCISWWTRIYLKNTGPTDFKSISISLKDTVTDQTSNSLLDGFQDVNACVLSTIAPKLGPGDVYTVVAPSLSADPTGHKVTATITLCSEIAQGGTCTSKTIEFTP